MSTLTEMREALEQLEQDARRFRWLCEHPERAEAVFGWVSESDVDDAIAYVRVSVDAERLSETPGPIEPAGAQT